MGEFGTSYAGSVFIAQCIRDALVYGYCKNPMDLRKSSANGGMGYDGYRENVNANAKMPCHMFLTMAVTLFSTVYL